MLAVNVPIVAAVIWIRNGTADSVSNDEWLFLGAWVAWPEILAGGALAFTRKARSLGLALIFGGLFTLALEMLALIGALALMVLTHAHS